MISLIQKFKIFLDPLILWRVFQEALKKECVCVYGIYICPFENLRVCFQDFTEDVFQRNSAILCSNKNKYMATSLLS